MIPAYFQNIMPLHMATKLPRYESTSASGRRASNASAITRHVDFWASPQSMLCHRSKHFRSHRLHATRFAADQAFMSARAASCRIPQHQADTKAPPLERLTGHFTRAGFAVYMRGFAGRAAFMGASRYHLIGTLCSSFLATTIVAAPMPVPPRQHTLMIYRCQQGFSGS